jgi:Domain of unknown function (DUF4328)
MVQQVGHVSQDGRWLWNGSEWVPNAPPVAIPSAAPWARPYESARYRATLLTIFLLISVASGVLLICLDLLLIIAGVQTPTDTEAILLGLFAVAVVIGFVGSYVPAVVFFCMWVHRVVRNMPALGAWDPRWSPAGAVWRSFIPFLNLAHPMSGTLEAWRGSDSTRRWINVSERKAIRVPGLMVGWWALWLIGNFVNNVSGRLTSNKDAVTAAAGEWMGIGGGLMLIGAAVLAVLVVREVTARQDRKNELIATGQLA